MPPEKRKGRKGVLVMNHITRTLKVWSHKDGYIHIVIGAQFFPVLFVVELEWNTSFYHMS